MTAVTVVTLAVGIGANVTMVGAIKHVLLRPPAFVKDADRVVRLLVVSKRQGGDRSAIGGASYPMLVEMQRSAKAFSVVAAFTSRALSTPPGRDAIEVRATLVSAEFFPLLGATPLLGRTFSSADGYPLGAMAGGPPLAVISHGFWKRHFAADTTVVNRSLHLGSTIYTIIGVMPDGFSGVDTETPDVWLPITSAAHDPAVALRLADRGYFAFTLLGRLRGNASQAAAAAQATALWRTDDLESGADKEPARVVAASLIRGRSPDATLEVKVSLWLAGVSALVLLLTCANVANVLLGRSFSRRHEMAVRLALGAGRGRIARQLLTEGLLLAGCSAIAALWMAALCGPLISRALVGEGPSSFIDPGLFVYVGVIAMGTGVLISIAPAAQSYRADLTAGFRTGLSASGARASRLRMVLLVAQSTLCMILLVGASLFALSLHRVTALDLGVDAEHTLRADVNLDQISLTGETVQVAYNRMLERVRSVSGVLSVAVASSNPYMGGRAVAVHTPESDADHFWPPGGPNIATEAAVGEGFFETVGAAMVGGRDFRRADDKSAPRVAIINKPLTKVLFNNTNPIGKCIVLPLRSDETTGGCVRVVGVLSGVWYKTLGNREKPLVYVPLAQVPSALQTGFDGSRRPKALFIRVRGDPGLFTETIRQALQGSRGDLPAVRVTRMRDILSAEVRPWRLGAFIFGLLGFTALVVAIVGLYGVVSFCAAQRTSEIAMRLALGARRQNILSLVARDAMAAIIIGVAAGAAVAFAVRKWFGALLFETAPSDPRVILGVAVLLMLVGLLAAISPTLRALRTDPAAALRRG